MSDEILSAAEVTQQEIAAASQSILDADTAGADAGADAGAADQAPEAGTQQQQPPAFTLEGREYRLIDSEGNELGQYDSLLPLLGGDVKMRITVDGQAVDLPLDKVVAKATSEAGLRKVHKTTTEERNTLNNQVRTLTEELTKAKRIDDIFRKIVGGDDEALQTARETYKQALARAGGKPPAEQQRGVPPEQQALVDAGVTVIEKVMQPQVEALAAAYGADPEEIATELIDMLNNEPPQFLTEERFLRIINQDIMERLEDAGYERVGEFKPVDLEAARQSVQKPNAKRGITPKGEQKVADTDEVARLRAELAELRAQQAPDGGARNSGDAGGKVSREEREKYKSEVIDVTEAGSVEEVLERLRQVS